MRDRIPTQVLENGALRYGVYDEAGNFLRHEYLALDDAPTDTGTDLSKATLLQDSTEVSLFGAAADRTVDDAFKGLAGQLKLIMGDMASITVTLKDSAGTAIPGVLVQGILSDSGQAVYSNDSGVAAGYISEGTQVVKVTGYADIEDYSETLSVTKGTSITKTITLTTRNFLKITSSQSVKFSGNVETVDVTVVGGGGGGGWCYGDGIARGGGGGHCVVQESVTIEANVNYNAKIAAGGNAASRDVEPGAGGESEFMGIRATGGNAGGAFSKNTQVTSSDAGIGNGNGGYVTVNYNWTAASSYVEPTAGTVAGYSSFTDVVNYGGGGMGGCGLHDSSDDDYFCVGNKTHIPYGGLVSEYDNTNPNGTSGFGGGGGARLTNAGGSSGKGGSGCVAVRMHLRSAA